MKGKIKYIVSCIFLLIVLIFFIVMLISTKVDMNFDCHILRGYHNKEKIYDDCGKDFTAFYQYYYDEKFDNKYEKRKEYKIINDDNIDHVRKYFKDYSEKVNFAFSIPDITIGDYYYLQNEDKNSVIEFYTYSLYLYDVKGHKLIYIHY